MRKTLSLAIVLALAAAAVPSLTVSADESAIEKAYAAYLAQRGFQRGPQDVENTRTIDFALAPGVDRYTVEVSWDTLAATVRPDGPSGAQTGPAGCVSPQVVITPVPWANDPPGVGVCPYQSHGFGFNMTAMACVDALGCFTDGLNFGAPGFAFFFIFCSAPVVVGDDGHPGWTPTVGSCIYGSVGPHPSTWTLWDSICGDAFPAGIGACLHHD